ncbi:hypothetical protein ACMFMG_006640 [Clarireedia jacksonii]
MHGSHLYCFVAGDSVALQWWFSCPTSQMGALACRSMQNRNDEMHSSFIEVCDSTATNTTIFPIISARQKFLIVRNSSKTPQQLRYFVNKSEITYQRELRMHI